MVDVGSTRNICFNTNWFSIYTKIFIARESNTEIFVYESNNLSWLETVINIDIYPEDFFIRNFEDVETDIVCKANRTQFGNFITGHKKNDEKEVMRLFTNFNKNSLELNCIFYLYLNVDRITTERDVKIAESKRNENVYYFFYFIFIQGTLNNFSSFSNKQ